MTFFNHALLSLMLSLTSLHAGIVRDIFLDTDDASPSVRFSKDISMVLDVAYGSHPKQTFDVYAPKKTSSAPVIFMVHGGAWKMGDKASKSVVYNKVNHWVNKGFIVISVNYRLLPQTSVVEQVSDIRLALMTARMYAASYGGDKDKFIIMGHSAGAHLISLVASKANAGILGAILLDSAALDVESIMRTKHLHLYDDAFGKDAASWRLLSAFHTLEEGAKPYLLVCSTKRDDSCAQAEAFASKAQSLNVKTTLLRQNLTHKEINETLGLGGNYTQAVDYFIQTLFTQSKH